MKDIKHCFIFLFFSRGVDENRAFYLLLNEGISKIKASGKIKVVILHTKHSKQPDNKPLLILKVLRGKSNGIGFDRAADINKGERNLTDAQTLETELRDLKEKNPAENYSVFIWGHSFGFGFFEKGYVDIESQRLQDALINDKERFKQLAKDTDLLSFDKLNQALVSVFPIVENRKGLQFICMAACCSQTLQAAFTLRNAANFLIGSQTMMDFKGYNFKAFIEASANIENDSDYSSLIKVFSSSMKDRYINDEDTLNLMSFSVINLAVLEDFAQKFDKLIRSLKNDNRRWIIVACQRARSKCYDMADVGNTGKSHHFYLVDLFDWLENLKREKINEKIFCLIDEIFSMQQLLVADLFKTEKYPNTVVPKGLNIYYPELLEQYYDDSLIHRFFRDDSYANTVFAKEFYWDNFLEQVIK